MIRLIRAWLSVPFVILAAALYGFAYVAGGLAAMIGGKPAADLVGVIFDDE